ncbi:magnesium transporter CorA family protein [Candidatus Peregrinibacteria bacterium]|nr:magnesium transporter CorA family protein [Candidatus Peregrinibacteria bacterium]
MYKIYKTSRGKLFNPETPVEDSWIDISAPNDDDLNDLIKHFEIPEEAMTSVKDHQEVPKVEEVDDFQFILVQTPYDPGESSPGYMVKPLGILYNKEHVITLTDSSNDVITYMKSKLKNFDRNKIINTSQKQQLILKMLLFVSKIFLSYLKDMNQSILKAQEEMIKNPDNKDIIKLMEIEKSLTYFNRALNSNYLIIQKIAKRKSFNMTEDDEELVQDVIDECKQALETTKIYEHIVTDTASGFATIVSNNLNLSVRFLTSITIILMLPTLVASVYGMNVKLPYMDDPLAFDYLMLIMILTVIIVAIWFYRKRIL